MKWLNRRIACPGPYLALCTSEKQYIKALKHLKIKSNNLWVDNKANATTHVFDNNSGELCCVVCINVEHHNKVEVYGLLVHEAVHVWQEYVQRIGEHTPGNEQMAYGIQNISQELINEFIHKKSN